jgi:hypothetical protein
MVNKTSIGLSVVGVGAMALGITGQINEELGMMAFILGFVLTVSGMAIGVRNATKVEPKTNNKKERKDSPAIIRAVGVGIGLASLATPYFRSPLTPEAAETAQSAVDVVLTAAEGVETSISFVLIILVVVALAGSFLSVFHHAGGYVMLLGSMTFVFISMHKLGSLELVTHELGYGLYLMLFAAFVIISSSLSDTTDVFDKGSDWSSKLLVFK